MIIFHCKLGEETNRFHINNYFVSVKHCLFFFFLKHISKEAEIKLPYLPSCCDTS